MKPTKKPHPHGPKRGNADAKVELEKLLQDWKSWYAKGMPQRAPLTKAELERRIGVLQSAVDLMNA